LHPSGIGALQSTSVNGSFQVLIVGDQREMTKGLVRVYIFRPDHASQWHTILMLKFATQQSLPTILLIDDDLVSREVLATVLTMSGYTVHTAADGDASLALLAGAECVPNVILMDTQMPGLSGIPLLKKLRAGSQASIYAISASLAPDEVVAASDGFLLKPFGAAALSAILEQRSSQPGQTSTQSESNPGPDSADPPPSFAVQPVVNFETLAQLREIMPESAVRQIYAAIVADLAKRLPELQSALASGNAAEVRRIGHAIKGGCGMAGALQAASLGALLESGKFDARVNHFDNAPPVLNNLRTATLNLQRMLEAEFPV
jgi:CheY-like chemotaxis protein